MTFGYKLSKLRKENNFTQEQLASILGVSRQSISKWESDLAYPETEKLIRIGELFHCSMDYLLKSEVYKTDKPSQFSKKFKERKSKKILWGMPLWCIAKNAKGIFAVGMNASGIFAIGLKAKGVFSFGVLSLGLFSCGLLSVGLISVGLFALGIFSCGCFGLGMFAAGAVCLGCLSMGAVAIGDFSMGALAIGKYFAAGDYAKAMIALGDTKAAGSVLQIIGELTSREIDSVSDSLENIVPRHLLCIANIVKKLLQFR